MEVEKVSDFNFLGVILDECLTRKPHIDKLSSELSRNAGILNKLKISDAPRVNALKFIININTGNCRIILTTLISRHRARTILVTLVLVSKLGPTGPKQDSLKIE